MKVIDWFKKWEFDSLKINAKFLELEFSFNDTDKKAAWEMYVELLTRVATQELKVETGDEKTALESVYSLFSITRDILKSNGASCINFARIAIIILNQKIRPFTAKWHLECLEDGFKDSNKRQEFRKDLKILQIELKKYTRMLSDLASVEDLSDFK